MLSTQPSSNHRQNVSRSHTLSVTLSKSLHLIVGNIQKLFSSHQDGPVTHLILHRETSTLCKLSNETLVRVNGANVLHDLIAKNRSLVLVENEVYVNRFPEIKVFNARDGRELRSLNVPTEESHSATELVVGSRQLYLTVWTAATKSTKIFQVNPDCVDLITQVDGWIGQIKIFEEHKPLTFVGILESEGYVGRRMVFFKPSNGTKHSNETEVFRSLESVSQILGFEKDRILLLKDFQTLLLVDLKPAGIGMFSWLVISKVRLPLGSCFAFAEKGRLAFFVDSKIRLYETFNLQEFVDIPCGVDLRDSSVLLSLQRTFDEGNS